MCIVSGADYRRLVTTPRSSSVDPLPMLEKLEREACACKVATKVMGCALLPITWGCCILTVGCVGRCCSATAGDFQHPKSQLVYSSWSASSLPGVWHSRLPPKGCFDQFCYIFDPCVCMLCLTEESPKHYLGPEKQRIWEDLQSVRLDREDGVARALFAHLDPHQAGHEYDLVNLVIEYAGPIEFPRPPLQQVPFPSPLSRKERLGLLGSRVGHI